MSENVQNILYSANVEDIDEEDDLLIYTKR